MSEIRYCTAGMALVEAERLTAQTGERHVMRFKPRRLDDFRPFTVEIEK